MGRYIIATRDLKPGELILAEAPLVIAPMAVTPPVCLVCYKPVDGRKTYVVISVNTNHITLHYINIYIELAINRTPHFGVWSALTPTLKFRGVWITAPTLTPALHLLLQKPIFLKKN